MFVRCVRLRRKLEINHGRTQFVPTFASLVKGRGTAAAVVGFERVVGFGYTGLFDEKLIKLIKKSIK